MAFRAMWPRVFLALITWLWASSPAAAQSTKQCYYPNGALGARDLPCNSSADVSSCCGSSSMCLDNGLCLRKGHVSRGSCTDPGWGPSCPQVCKDASAGGGIPLSLCEITNEVWDWFTCGFNVTCTKDNMFQLQGGGAVLLRTEQVAPLGFNSALNVSSTTVLRSVAEHGNNTTSSSCGSFATETHRTGYSPAAMAGVGVGIGAPLLLALLAAIFVIFRQHKKLKAHITKLEPTKGDKLEPTTSYQQWTNLETPSTLPSYHSPDLRKPGPLSTRCGELENTPVNEMEAQGSRWELYGDCLAQSIPRRLT